VAARFLILTAAGLGVVVFVAFAYHAYFGIPPWHAPPRPLPKIDRGNPNAISPRDITVVDGDTIQARGRTIRLVGFDAPESGLLSRCPRERELAQRATAQLESLVAGGNLELRLVPCACPPGTEGIRWRMHSATSLAIQPMRPGET
jgi:endonuclease YncB( thermonuclease family)